MSRILLIGPPGAGKSTVGRALAEHLSMRFLDTDALIEEKSGKAITDIFVVEGEPVFRAMEFETLSHVLTEDDAVVSLGGGAPFPIKLKPQLLNQHPMSFSLMSL